MTEFSNDEALQKRMAEFLAPLIKPMQDLAQAQGLMAERFDRKVFDQSVRPVVEQVQAALGPTIADNIAPSLAMFAAAVTESTKPFIEGLFELSKQPGLMELLREIDEWAGQIPEDSPLMDMPVREAIAEFRRNPERTEVGEVVAVAVLSAVIMAGIKITMAMPVEDRAAYWYQMVAPALVAWVTTVLARRDK